MLCPRKSAGRGPKPLDQAGRSPGFLSAPSLPHPVFGKGEDGIVATANGCTVAPYTDNAAKTAWWRHFTVTRPRAAVRPTWGGRRNLLKVNDYFLHRQRFAAHRSALRRFTIPRGPGEAARGPVVGWIEIPSLSRSSGAQLPIDKRGAPVLKGPQVRSWQPRTRVPSWS